eukprot:TRINITY_DN6612_c0_g5_i2.p1 TRINITY_DN6612_c0_g5~~TRINITY_DN6612_c0_g5_i2.p1  ORF type:complete len:263 (-),score=71.30 TRINITY_DN6612_c0_g5_i2:867-1628(-)
MAGSCQEGEQQGLPNPGEAPSTPTPMPEDGTHLSQGSQNPDSSIAEKEEDELDREAAELLEELQRSQSEIHHLSMQHAEHQCMLSSMKQTLSMDLEEARLERWCLEQHQELEDLKNRLVATRMSSSPKFDVLRLVKDEVDWEELMCPDAGQAENNTLHDHQIRDDGLDDEIADATAALEAEMEREWEEVRTQLTAAKAAQAALERTRAGLLAEIAELKQAVTEEEPTSPLGVSLTPGIPSATDPSPQIATIQV